MNKEVKSLIERIKMDIENWSDCGCTDDDICTDIILEIGQWKTLLGYINQLETNRDEVIECIKEFLCTEEYIKVDGVAIANNYAEIVVKLERGKK